MSYAAAPRKGRVPGTGPDHPSYFAADPLLGWCSGCGWPWEAGQAAQPDPEHPWPWPSTACRFGDGSPVNSAVHGATGGHGPLNQCLRCAAPATARVGPRLWAEQLYQRLDGDLLGVRYYARTQELPSAVAAAFEDGEISVEQLTWWRATARQRWEELTDNPRCHWLDEIHAYGPSFAPLSEFLPEYVDEHDPLTCPACIRRQDQHGGLRDWMQGQVRAAVVARAKIGNRL